MKKVLIVLLLVATTCQAWAAEGEPKDFSVSVGAKAWYMDWSSWIDTERNASITLNADSELTFIPSLTVRYKNFFLNGSYALPTDFSFYEFDYVMDDAGSATLVTNKFGGERSEYDVNVGYMITPNLAVTAGWKDIKQEFSWWDSFTNTTANFDWNMSGPTLGLAGSAMMSEKLGMYGNLGYGFLKNDDADVDVEYLSYELGLVFIPMSKVNVTLGYKSQFVDSELSSNHIGRDVTRGVLLGANYSF